MNKIAIIYTTFLRPILMYQTIESIFTNWKQSYFLLIGNQSYTIEQDDKLNELIKKYPKIEPENVHHINLTFDFGLSASRNYLVSIAYEKHIPFCFLTADSIEFTNKYYLEPFIDFLKSNDNYGLVGFDIDKRIPWEGYINKTTAFDLHPSEDFVSFEYLRLKKIDICRNFFLAKTNVLYKNKWDEDLKLLEHEDFAWRLKSETSYKSFYSNLIKGSYITYKTDEYMKYRKRAYKEFKDLLLKKWKLSKPFRLVK